jgi:DNA-sulfur modification-associated
MAITMELGGIRRHNNIFTTVIPISRLVELTVPGMAFEPKEARGDKFDHLDPRVQELYAARGSIQRAFFHRAMENVRVTDPDTGEKRTERRPTGWTPTRKYKNATGDLRKYIEGPFLDTPPLQATLPAFTIYVPEYLEGKEADFNARMGGEFYVYTLDEAKKAMEADGESRLLAIRLALAANSKLSGSRQEKLRATLVTVEVIHGVEPAAMGQMFADLNGKGVTLTKNEIEGLDIRDPWTKATKEIFEKLNVPLVTTGRQVTAVDQAENKHLIIGQAVTMVRAIGLPFSKAVSATAHDEVIKAESDYERLVDAGVRWFGHVLDHFGAETLPDGTRDARVFTDPDLVVRAVPIKVALGVMGNAWFEVNRPKQAEHKKALREIDWRVSQRWQGIAGKVSQKVEKQKVDGRTIRVPVEDEFTLAAAGAKEVGAAAVRALTNPNSQAGRLVRNLSPVTVEPVNAAA